MTFPNEISRMLPMLPKIKTCEACGESFACGISEGKSCWCGEVTVSDETRQGLRATYQDCLCRACLEEAESKKLAAD